MVANSRDRLDGRGKAAEMGENPYFVGLLCVSRVWMMGRRALAVQGHPPPKWSRSVKLHEWRSSGSKNLTLICELGAGPLFSNCFWNEPRLRFQEWEQFVSGMWGRDAKKWLTIQG